MKNLYSLAVAQLTVGGEGSQAGVTPVGEEDMEWMKENLLLDQLNAAIAALGTEEVRGERNKIKPSYHSHKDGKLVTSVVTTFVLLMLIASGVTFAFGLGSRVPGL